MGSHSTAASRPAADDDAPTDVGRDRTPGPGWRVDVHYRVDGDRQVDRSTLAWLIFEGSDPPRLDRDGVAELFRELARAGEVFDADVPHLLESIDGGSVEFWIHGRGARLSFTPDLSDIDYLVHQAPGRDEVGINVYIRPRR